MAGAVDAVLSFGLQKLWSLLSQEYEQYEGVEDRVTELKTNIGTLQSLVEDAEVKKLTSAVVGNFLEQIKDIIFDTEDIFETFLQKEKRNWIKKPFIKRKLASDIEGMRERISSMIDSMGKNGVQRTVSDERSIIHPLHEKQSDMRKTFHSEYEGTLVGLEANVEELVRYLVKNDDIQVVSITGMGGVGKTSLARQVFNHKDVKHHFHGCAWVCVSQEFTRTSLWQEILQKLKPEFRDEIMKMTEDQLQSELWGLLKTSKSLIVLDDIWEERHWKLLMGKTFSPEKGCKVLLTSRNESVAVRRDQTYKNCKAECLSPENSWTLFRSIAFLPTKDDSEYEEMEKMGKQMIKFCGGLPLAIRVLGGLLAVKCKLHNWKRVYEDIRTHIFTRPNINDEKERLLYNILSLSYEELSIPMKHCFLYLAIFPEDYLIDVQQLSYQWDTEGFLPLPGQSTTPDVAYDFLEELDRRNMVILENDITFPHRETCHLHDMMREVCLLKSKEENFLHIANTSSSSSSSSTIDTRSPPRTPRRFISQNPTIFNVASEINNSSLRSLVVVGFDGRYPKTWELSKGLCFKRLQLLRRLDLSGAEFKGKKLPSSIGKLILLKYLSLEGAKLSHLPKTLRNLKLLIYLNISISEGPIFVPNVLSEMEDLRYLCLPNDMHEKTKLELGKLVKLETLAEFVTANGNVGDLRGMERLKNLTITLTEETSIETLSASVAGLRNLECLLIMKYSDHAAHTNHEEDGSTQGSVNKGAQPWVEYLDTNAIMSERMIKEVLDLANLKMLLFQGIYMPRLPDVKHFPSRLTSLTLFQSGLKEDPMPTLEKLLQLKNCFIYDLAFIGSKMVCSAGGFPRLHTLELSGLPELVEWKVEELSMTLLRSLDISKCGKLKALPDALRLITSLEALKFREMGDKWKDRLSEGGQDYEKFKHIPSVIFGTV